MQKPLILLTSVAILGLAFPVGAETIPAHARKPVFVNASADASLKTEQQAAPPPEKKLLVEVQEDAFVVSNKSDLMLSCQELRKEVAAMGKIIGETEAVKDRSAIQSKGISAAGAVGSFLVGTVTGGIGLAAAGLMLDHSVSNNKDDADEIQDIAEQRRTWIKGLYTAQACEGPIETPEQEKKIREAQQNHQNVIDQIAKMETAAGKPKKESAFEKETELKTPYND